MKKLMDQKEFAEKTAYYIRNALPEELADAIVHTALLNIWADGSHMTLLLTHPWNNTTTGFRLDGWFQKYLNGNATVESVAAAIINDRRLYVIPSSGCIPDISGMEGSAVIYA